MQPWLKPKSFHGNGSLFLSRQSFQVSPEACELEKVDQTAKNPMIFLYKYAHTSIPISGTA